MINHRPLVVPALGRVRRPHPDPPRAATSTHSWRSWEDSNREVARRYVGDGDVLFRLPRKTNGTTTDQRLDPDRLDHFLELAELPERLHAPLRELAEQECRLRPWRSPSTSAPARRGPLDPGVLPGEPRPAGELGVLYPSSPGVARHGKLGLYLKSDEERESSANWYRQKHSDPVRFRRAFRRQLLDELGVLRARPRPDV